jgi:hypothetical protein
MALIDDITALVEASGAQVQKKKDTYKIDITIAERKAFLSKKKLQYIASFKVDDGAKAVHFTEMLKESGSGMSGGGDFDDSGITSGFGFKTETYKTGAGPREGTIEEQSNFFGKNYDYRFDFRTIRKQVEELAGREGYEFFYSLTARDW